MARAPARRRAAGEDDEPLTFDPMDGAVFADAVGVAGQLSELLESLAGYDQGSIKAVLFRKPNNGMGAFEWIEEIPPPFDMTAIMQSLKDRFNGGKYRMQIFAGGKTRKNVEFSIMTDPTRLVGASQPQRENTDMFMAMMKMSQDSSDRQMQMMQMMQSQQMQMMQSSQQSMTSLLAAMMGNREKASDLIPLFAALRPTEEKTSLKDTVETITAIQGLFPKGDASGLGSLDADGLIDGALKLAGPVAGAIGKAFEARGRRLNGEAQQQEEAPTGLEPAPRPLMLARPAPVPAETHEPAAPTTPGKFPILNAVRPDIAYFFGRRHDPELAAEAIVALLSDVPGAEEMVNELVATFAISPDWKSDLAAEGIDLRADPEWADQFLSALVAEWTDPERGADDPQRGAGDAGDLEGDGEAGADGLAIHAGAQSGG